MSRSIGLLALLLLAVVSILAALAVTRPIRVAPPAEAGAKTADAPVAIDGGVLDSFLDAIHLEHSIKHGR